MNRAGEIARFGRRAKEGHRGKRFRGARIASLFVRQTELRVYPVNFQRLTQGHGCRKLATPQNPRKMVPGSAGDSRMQASHEKGGGQNRMTAGRTHDLQQHRPVCQKRRQAAANGQKRQPQPQPQSHPVPSSPIQSHIASAILPAPALPTPYGDSIWQIQRAVA